MKLMKPKDIMRKYFLKEEIANFLSSVNPIETYSFYKKQLKSRCNSNGEYNQAVKCLDKIMENDKTKITID